MRTAGAQVRGTRFSSGQERLASFASGIMRTLGGRCQEHHLNAGAQSLASDTAAGVLLSVSLQAARAEVQRWSEPAWFHSRRHKNGPRDARQQLTQGHGVSLIRAVSVLIE